MPYAPLLIQLFNANATSYKKLETPVMNFVVGSYNTEIDAPKVEQKEEQTSWKSGLSSFMNSFTSAWVSSTASSASTSWKLLYRNSSALAMTVVY